MSTTQCSESMHAFFDGYVNSKTTLKQFVNRYENALRDKVEKENLTDFSSFNSLVPCLTPYPIEKQFQDAYTATKFKESLNELKARLNCVLFVDEDNGHYSKFIVREDVMVGETSHRHVSLLFS
ncbi:hypothetical protein Ddye_012018 [Dipteronia dyeriana]|uniref:Protein FAR1-RELATED SEQUENCE n=1 Tax=Dipteronia dyeriana TaxID=168575 RepID=A0AAD9X3Q7_9ROSI|nr:hypothetical protein Ddye_012018 [Dipteronia dyeriana]